MEKVAVLTFMRSLDTKVKAASLAAPLTVKLHSTLETDVRKGLYMRVHLVAILYARPVAAQLWQPASGLKLSMNAPRRHSFPLAMKVTGAPPPRALLLQVALRAPLAIYLPMSLLLRRTAQPQAATSVWLQLVLARNPRRRSRTPSSTLGPTSAIRVLLLVAKVVNPLMC